MRYLILFQLTLGLVGCGNLQPEDPDSKLNSAQNAAPNGTPNATPNNGAANGVTVDAGTWGTDGPATMDGKSPDGNARCTLDDVLTEDLAAANSSEVPADPWDGSPVADATARCGDDLETLGWRLFNCERIGAGRQPTSCDLRLVWMGREHTLDMIRQDYFRHDNPAGESPFDRLNRHGIEWRGAAENIATGRDVLEAHYRWMDSQGHRENILGPYSHVGIGT